MRVIFIGNARVLYRTGDTILQVLRRVPGLSFNFCLRLCAKLGVNVESKFSSLLPEHIRRLNKLIKKNIIMVGEPSRKKVILDKMFQIRLGMIRGLRTRLGLPCKGQRTRSNGRTAKRLKRALLLRIRNFNE